MSRNRKSALALFAGTLGGLLTMAIHPVAAGPLPPAQLNHLALSSAIAHSLGIASFLLTFLGACGLTHMLNAEPRAAGRPGDASSLPFAALVLYAFACIAVLIAAAVSGFIAPTLLRHMAHDGAAYDSTWRIVLDAVFQFNQAFARIYSVAASVSIVLWSAFALRHGGLPRALAFYGCTLPPVLILLVAVGHLRLNVHGMLAVVLVHTLWFLPACWHLWRGDAQA